MAIRIIPFHTELLPQAGELLAQRHRRDRAVLHGLPDRFENPSTASLAIQTALKRDQAGGFAALDGERLVAYLVGDMVFDETYFGRAGWVRAPGCAYDPRFGVEIVRDLYAALGERWVSYGIYSHFALIPISDPALLQAWFALSFGIQHVHALAELETLNLQEPAPTYEIEICKAGLQNRQHLAAMADIIWQHQVKAPVWSPMLPEVTSKTPELWASQLDEGDVTVWLAFQNGEVVGSQGYWPAETSDENLFVPENAAYMSLAATKPAERGQGIGKLLSHRVLSEIRASGYHFCETNWRSTNLLADRFWPRQGYQPVAYRLTRLLDPRIAWANGTHQDG